MPKLYELTNEYLGFWDSLNDPEADWDAAEEKLKSIEAALDSKVENCARAIRGMESDAESIAVEIERLARRKRALENKTESLRGYVQGEMMAAGRDKVQTDLFTVALQKSPAKLIVHAEADIPREYFKIIPETVQLDKDAVRTALKAGNAVPGCELAQGYHLRIR